MISHKHRFIFIHIPKTGGNSIQTVLAPLSDDTILSHVGHQDGLERFAVRGRLTPFKHVDLDYYAQRVKLDRFTVVACRRHPVDRLLSSYFSPCNWFVRHRDDTWHLQNAYWDRERFLADLAAPSVAYLRVDGVFRKPDFSLSFDRLEDDFADFLRAVDIPASASLPKLNVTSSSEAYEAARADPIVTEIARSRYREDFEKFGFPLP